MKGFINRTLGRLGLYDFLTLDLAVSSQIMVEKFSKKLDKSRPDLFDGFTFNKREYKGTITQESFSIKKCKSFIISFEHFAEASGTMQNSNGKLKINADFFQFSAILS